MENKKRKKPNWRNIVPWIQFSLLLYMTTMGFIFTYLFIWFAVDSLPQEPWVIVVCAVAGLLSTGGLCTWIIRWDKEEISKKEMCESAKSVCSKNCESCAWNELE